MQTIAQIVQHLRPGGIETMVLDLTRFTDKNEQTFIISLEGTKEAAIKNWPRLKPFANRLFFLDKKPGLSLSLLLELRSLLKKLNVDAVHTHHIGPLLYGGIASRLAGTRLLIHTEHDAWHLSQKRRRILQRFVIKLAKPLLVADAKTVAAAMQRYLKLKDIRIIRNGVDTHRFVPGDAASARGKLGLPLNITLIGCSGRLEPVKGQQDLIKALTFLPENIHLAIAGTGSLEKKLKILAKKLNLEHRVYFLGHLEDMPLFYQSLNIFCLPSLNEGYPLAPLEAQACNIPTIVTDVGGSHETLCPDIGHLVPANNSEQLAIAIQKLMISGKKVTSRNFVKTHGDVREMTKAYFALRYTGVQYE